LTKTAGLWGHYVHSIWRSELLTVVVNTNKTLSEFAIPFLKGKLTP
jgi:hypothetical protein